MLALAAFGTAATAVAAEDAATESRGAERHGEPLQVCYYDFDPLVGRGADGRPRGLYVDLLEHVAAGEGWRLEYGYASWDECLRQLDRGEVDLVPVVGYSEARARRFAFTSEVPVLDWGVVFTRAGSPIENVLDLRGKRVGVLRGSIYTDAFRALISQFRIECELVEKDDYRSVFAALAAGELDAGINAQLAGAAIAPSYHLEPSHIYFSPVRLAFAAPAARAARLRVLDARLAELRSRPGSAWHEALARWMPGRAVQRVPAWLAPVLAVAALLILVAAAFAWALRRQVASRTADLRAANAHLHDSQVLLRAFSDAIPDPIFMKDRAGRWLFANPAVLAVIGKPAAEVLGRTDRELYADPEIGAALMETDRRIMDAGCAEVVEETVQTPAGYRIFLSTKVPHRGAGGEVIGIIGCARDVTDHRRTEEQLRQAQKLESIGRLAGGVAHDFNNLLTVILSCATALEEAAAAGEPARLDDVHEVRAAGQRAAELTRQLLAFARKQSISPVPLDLNGAVRASERLLRRVLGEDVRLAVSLHPDLWPVHCDPGQLEQVILNLAVNARDAMPRGGDLAIETSNVEGVAAGAGRARGDHVRLAIRDTGMGMSDAVKAHLFEPFFTTKGPGRGTGLGLATVYGIVKQSGGHVEVDSGVGRGTTVEVWLPRTHARPAAAAAPPERRARGGRERVLVVEDDPRVREVTERALRAGGYEVLVAATGAEALAADARGVQLLVTDVVMPGMDGPSVAEALGRRHPGLRVLFVSGYAPDALAGSADGRLELLAKPFTPATLLSRVREVLDAGS